jgi:hypothetical protein
VAELGGLRVSSWAAPNGAAYRASGCTFGWSATSWQFVPEYLSWNAGIRFAF